MHSVFFYYNILNNFLFMSFHRHNFFYYIYFSYFYVVILTISFFGYIFVVFWIDLVLPPWICAISEGYMAHSRVLKGGGMIFNNCFLRAKLLWSSWTLFFINFFLFQSECHRQGWNLPKQPCLLLYCGQP